MKYTSQQIVLPGVKSITTDKEEYFFNKKRGSADEEDIIITNVNKLTVEFKNT